MLKGYDTRKVALSTQAREGAASRARDRERETEREVFGESDSIAASWSQ